MTSFHRSARRLDWTRLEAIRRSAAAAAKNRHAAVRHDDDDIGATAAMMGLGMGFTLHPKEHKVINILGKDTPIPRYQQAYGESYAFSGIVSEAIPATTVIEELFDKWNALLPAASQTSQLSQPSMEFNSCLCNWYAPHHCIGIYPDSYACCEETHKHEILKRDTHKHGGNRINFSIRCFK